MIMWDKPQCEYIEIYKFIDYSEELLGKPENKALQEVINWLSNKKSRIVPYINFKGYCLIYDATLTPYRSYSQCNYIHAWIKLDLHVGRMAKRYLERHYEPYDDEFRIRRAIIDKLITTQYISSKYLPKELDPITPLELKERQEVVLGIEKPFFNDSRMAFDKQYKVGFKELYFKKDDLLKIVSPKDIELSRDEQIIRLLSDKRVLEWEIKDLKSRVASVYQSKANLTNPVSGSYGY